MSRILTPLPRIVTPKLRKAFLVPTCFSNGGECVNLGHSAIELRDLVKGLKTAPGPVAGKARRWPVGFTSMVTLEKLKGNGVALGEMKERRP